VELLADADNRVIALSGNWGTGKSHLWKDVQAASKDTKIHEAVYVSLFGSRSIAELKLKIAQSALPSFGAGGAGSEKIKNGLVGIKKLLEGFHSGFSALDQFALAAAPLIIKNRFIVIDDIERKHDGLAIEEILGFIDDCVQNLGCRILLILNSDQLEDKQHWEFLREKVIDQELQLDTSPTEAFDIAAVLTPSAVAAHIKPAVEACQLTNIRVIRKIIRVVNRLLDNRAALPPGVLARIIPSATLLSAIHYKGLENGPDFDFVLNFEEVLVAMVSNARTQRGEDETPEAKARERWRLLLDKLGIRGTDEFEVLVVAYLKSGLMESAAIGKIIDRYLAEGHALTARASAFDFFERCIWRPDISEEELVSELRAMLPNVGLLDMFAATSLHDQAMRLAGGADLAPEIIKAWISAFQEQHPAGQEPQVDSDFNFFGRPLHPDIEAEIRAMQKRQQSSVTVLDVCRKVREQRGWGTREESFMQSVTPADYETAIRSATGADLKLLLLQSMIFFKNPSQYDAHFGSANKSFLAACQAIVQREPDSRLGKLVRDVFDNAGKGSELTVPAAAAVPAVVAPVATPASSEAAAL